MLLPKTAVVLREASALVVAMADAGRLDDPPTSPRDWTIPA